MALPSEEIKQKLDIVRLLKDYLDLRPAGRNFKAHCPFHQEISPSDQKQFGILYDINSAAAIFWNNILESSKRAWEYLGSRGLKRETVAEFEIGFAPNEFDILTLHLLKEGFNMEDIVRAGLAF